MGGDEDIFLIQMSGPYFDIMNRGVNLNEVGIENLFFSTMCA